MTKRELEDLKSRAKHNKEMTAQLIRAEAPLLYWAQTAHINSRGARMSFKDMPALRDLYIYLPNWPQFAMQKSVQYGISELFICLAHLEASNGLTVLYTLPTHNMRNRFVKNRINRLYLQSPAYSKLIKNSESGDSKSIALTNFGKGVLAWLGSTVESEMVEIPGDSYTVDEVDRCNLRNLELLPDRVSASPYGYARRVSNPTVEGVGINEYYQKGTQREWLIKCEHCGRMFIPDFFEHVVRQVGLLQYTPRDPNFDREDPHCEIRIIHECGGAIENRFKDGEWVAKYPNRIIESAEIGKITNKVRPLRNLYDIWIDSVGNQIKEQVFYNSQLGKAYSSKGAKITEADLNSNIRQYTLQGLVASGPIVVGIDVGGVLHYTVRQCIKEQGIIYTQLLELGTCNTFSELVNKVIRVWNPRVGVIDAGPETHSVQTLKEEFKFIYSCRYAKDKLEMGVNRQTHEILIDRTGSLDALKERVIKQQFMIPQGAPTLLGGEYYSHMTSSTRILRARGADEDDVAAINDSDKTFWEYVHSKPDHFFHAENYCNIAATLLPDYDGVLNFMRGQLSNVPSTANGILAPVIMDVATGRMLSSDNPNDVLERERVANLARKTPEQILNEIRARNRAIDGGRKV
jgi:hypothetical protein